MGAAEANDRSPNVAKVFTEGGSRRSSLFGLMMISYKRYSTV